MKLYELANQVYVITQHVDHGLAIIGEWHNTDVSPTVCMSMRMALDIGEKSIGHRSKMTSCAFNTTLAKHLGASPPTQTADGIS